MAEAASANTPPGTPEIKKRDMLTLLTGSTDEVERFIKLMTVVGLVEVSRTGVAAMARGAEGISG